MGIFLNSAAPYSLYESEVKKPYFVDKSLMLEELFLPAETGNSHICITRPRRFGKTVMANMVSAFFSHGVDSTEIFSKLKIAESTGYKKHLNTYDVIRIDFSRMPRNCNSYDQYIERIERILIQDLRVILKRRMQFGIVSTLFMKDMDVSALFLYLMSGTVFSIRTLSQMKTRKNISVS